MDLGILVLGLVGLAIALAFMHVVSSMASEREAAARHKPMRHRPFADDTCTQTGQRLF